MGGEKMPSNTEEIGRRYAIPGPASAIVLVLLVLAMGLPEPERLAPAMAPPPFPTVPAASDAHQGFIYGRITTDDGATYEGRLRWGGDEEAFWGDYFNGVKDENTWISYVSPERLKERRSIEFLGVEVAHWERQLDLGRPFMARFGDITRIEALRRHIWVTLKSGTVIDLDRFSADDLADGLRVWDTRRGIVDLDEWGIRLIELLPTPQLETAPERLHGTVRTRNGSFTGFLQWNREEGVSTDELNGMTADREVALRFDTMRSIAHDATDGSLVTLLNGRQIVVSGTREAGLENRGVYVDDRRYGRVLVSWDAFERVDFSPAGIGPAFGDFPPGLPLTGSVTSRAGHRLTGRLVYDLDESETTETLDAPSLGVDYTIPFGLIASITLPVREDRSARVILHNGEKVLLERSGDLGKGNAGMLIFVDNRERPEYLRWTEIERVDFDSPPSMYPPF
jgi:hypothetical protein